MKSTSALIIALTMLAAPLEAQSLESPNSFVEEVIDSLAAGSGVRDLLVKSTDNEVQEMTNIRSAILKLEQAQRRLSNYSKSNDHYISSLAEKLSGEYGGLAGVLGKILDLYERQLRLNAQVADGGGQNVSQQIAEMQIEGSKLAAQMNEAWKLMAQSSAIASYVLIDLTRKEGGYLLITSKERSDLRARLEKVFKPAMLEKSGGGHAVDVASSLLWKFLGQPEWKMADPAR